MNSLDCKKPALCPPAPEEIKEIYPPATPEFTVCVGDYSLAWDGTRLHKTRPRTTPDGEYGSVTVVDGCIVAYGDTEVPTYTPPYCNPNPAPCGDGTDAGPGSAIQVSPAAGNQLTNSALGLYAKAHVQAGTGIAVAGNGSQANPYIVTTDGTASAHTQVVAGARIKVEELIPNQKTISLQEGGIGEGTYAGFSVDKFGMISAYTPATAGEVAIASIIGGQDIKVTTDAGIVTVAHENIGAGVDMYIVGDSEITVSATGHVTGIEKIPPTTRRRPLLDFYRIELRVPVPADFPTTPVDYDQGYIDVESYDAPILLVSRTITTTTSTYVLQLNNYITQGDYIFGATASTGKDRVVVTPTVEGQVTIKYTHDLENASSLLARIALTIREA